MDAPAPGPELDNAGPEQNFADYVDGVDQAKQQAERMAETPAQRAEPVGTWESRSEAKAAAMKQEFENARDGFYPELEKHGEVERWDDPALNLKPSHLSSREAFEAAGGKQRVQSEPDQVLSQSADVPALEPSLTINRDNDLENELGWNSGQELSLGR